MSLPQNETSQLRNQNTLLKENAVCIHQRKQDAWRF